MPNYFPSNYFPSSECRKDMVLSGSVLLTEIFHEPKASEISHHISQCNKCFILVGTPPGSFSH